MLCWKEIFLAILIVVVEGRGSPFGPKYPITASWFRDRFSYQEWNRTLAEFQEQGGDTVFLRAPPIVRRTREDLMADPKYAWCGSSNSSTGASGPHCYDEAVKELTAMGLNVTALVTYDYEEGFSDVIMACPRTDRVINSSRIYYRIVLPADKFNESNPCDYANGTKVVLLLTSFAGTDPHSLLLTAAGHRNMSVFFGLPAAPRELGQLPRGYVGSPSFPGPGGAGDDDPGSPVDSTLLQAYYAWVFRVLREHEARYSKVKVTGRAPGGQGQQGWRQQQKTSVYNGTLAGYYSRDEDCLAQINDDSSIVAVYRRLGELVHARPAKQLAVSPYVNVNRAQLNSTVEQHVRGFDVIAATGQVDVIIVQEGRGWGRGCYYWPGQENATVRQMDPTLDRILHFLHPALKTNITFQEACSASNQQIFAALERSRDAMVAQSRDRASAAQLWLGVETFEYLRDDPCLPLDPQGSGLGQILDRASKNRVDRALTVASVRVQKVIAFAWDPDFTCTTRSYKGSLAALIRTQAGQPLIANCSFHSAFNRSIVVIGYNLEGMQQGFEIDWPSHGKRRVSHLYGYYFELDWGARHNRVPSLEYTQLYDLPNVLTDLDSKGRVKVKAEGASNVCIFEYDFSRSAPFLPKNYRRFYRR